MLRATVTPAALVTRTRTEASFDSEKRSAVPRFARRRVSRARWIRGGSRS